MDNASEPSTTCGKIYATSIVIAYAVLNASSGMLSFIGYSVIIYIIFRGGRRKLARVYNRLLLALSFIGLLNSVALALSFLPAPKDLECSIGIGNISTCTFQGFLLQFSLAIPAYTAMLSIYYLIVIIYNVPEDKIAKRFEPFMHFFAVVPTLSGGIFAAAKKLFLSHAAHCWISQNACEGDCTKNKYGDGLWLVVASMAWGIFNTIVIVVCSLLIYCKVRRRAVAVRKYLGQSKQDGMDENRRRNKVDDAVNQSSKQAILYAVGHILTYCWTVTSIVFGDVQYDGALYLLNATFLPLQGFWIFLVFTYPRFLYLRKHHKLSVVSTFKAILFAGRDENEELEQTCGNVQEKVSFPLPSLAIESRMPHNKTLV